MCRIILSVILFFTSSPSLAQSTFSNEVLMPSRTSTFGSEYISGSKPGVVLMKVNLWGSVQKPGIHHIPAKTDLVSLFSYAGGPTELAELDEVIIKRNGANGSEKKISVNVEEILKGSATHNIVLEPNDIIVVPTHKPMISQDTTGFVGLMATLATMLLTTFVLIEKTKD